ncbi:MAG: tRNA (adenosine(37)-N6)-threonylcarbamoyltransferase complex ATPase subunit type 1 TsaE [Bdellovibrionaceae bacterium]|nr:tRNA (adenosine(37)-N6)-threonylcarbamoyltransferase complex ATPase subunit type 1 TsaE [Pseudobdellovibrionaceae bacterium]
MNLIFSETLQNINDLNQIINKIKPYLKSHSLILLDGDLGAGKTTLTSELLKSCGYAQVTSPTYALHHSYPVVLNHENISIEHLDLYRLQNEDDVESSGLWDLFQNPQSVIIVEWADRISIDQWPLDWNRYRIKITKSDDHRTYHFYSF